MDVHEVGFMSSWRMLTRDKGWIKPVLVLTLVGWIPILGQIAVLGYALEWARLTAWGVDAAPKQRDVDYGKVFSTGGRAFMVTLTLGVVIALLLQIVFPGSLVWLLSGTTAGSMGASYAAASIGGIGFLLLFVFMVLSSTFVTAAALRATIYDSFGAGWRLDRLFQMVGRDAGGFLKAYLVSLIGGFLSVVYSVLISLLGFLTLAGGVLGAVGFAGAAGVGYPDEYIVHQLLTWGAGPALLLVLCGIAAAFVGGVLATSMNLVSINAVGQWFSRFDVNRWGVSSAPLPDGVPRTHAGGAGSVPVNPTAASQDPAPSYGVAPAAPAQSASPASNAPVDPVMPLDAEPAADVKDEPVAIPLPPISEPAAQPAAQDAKEGVDSIEVQRNEEAAESEGTAAETTVLGETEPEATKKPIPLGPITSNDDDSNEDGPISI